MTSSQRNQRQKGQTSVIAKIGPNPIRKVQPTFGSTPVQKPDNDFPLLGRWKGIEMGSCDTCEVGFSIFVVVEVSWRVFLVGVVLSGPVCIGSRCCSSCPTSLPACC